MASIDQLLGISICYNHAFRNIMKYDRTCSASGMFVSNIVRSFN